MSEWCQSAPVGTDTLGVLAAEAPGKELIETAAGQPFSAR